jgi:hypothetical protein
VTAAKSGADSGYSGCSGTSPSGGLHAEKSTKSPKSSNGLNRIPHGEAMLPARFSAASWPCAAALCTGHP